MRRVDKGKESKILADNLMYSSENTNNNRKIAEILLLEQKSFCAYTDEYINRTDARDIEHFDPTLKDSPQDSYNNWFIVKHKWNSEKATKWSRFQPVLHPTALDLEKRIIYLNGDYVAASSSDTEASNLIKLLKLDDAILAENRKKYIARKHQEIREFNIEASAFFEDLIRSYPGGISYLRAIKEEFEVNLWDLM